MKLLRAVLPLALVLVAGVAHADPPAAATGVSRPAAAAPSQASEGVVNINTGTQEELERLPGVGPARAEAIVRLRTRVQRFGRVEDLTRVRGIGRATLRHMRPYLTLTGPTTLESRPGRRSSVNDG